VPDSALTLAGIEGLPQNIASYILAASTWKSPYVKSGAATADPRYAVNMGGSTITVPRFERFTEASEANDGVTASDVKGFTDNTDVAVVCRRKKSFAIAGNLKAALAAGDEALVMRLVQEAQGDYWTREMDASLGSVLASVFNPTDGILRLTNTHNIGTAANPKKNFSYGVAYAGLAKMGDNMGRIALWIMHSLVWVDAALEGNGFAQETRAMEPIFPGSSETVEVVRATYAGRPVIISDNVPYTGTGEFRKFATIGLAKGALNLAMQREVEITEGVEARIPQRLYTPEVSFSPHFKGVKWTGTVNAQGPLPAALATASNWAAAYGSDPKEYGGVAIYTNASLATA
jgi:hypothetical protein